MKCLLVLAGILVSTAFSFSAEILSESVSPSGTFEIQAETPPSVSFGAVPGSRAVHMLLHDQSGNTIWSCPLESTDTDFYNHPVAVVLRDGGYAVNCPPDCFTSSTPFQRISAEGENLWSVSIETEFILGSCDFVELSPRILTIQELRDGNIIISGRVAPFLGSSDAWFAVCLDGISGEPVWKAWGYAMGQASVNDVLETDSGMLMLVGATAVNASPENGPESVRVWGDKNPLILMLNASGGYLGLLIPELELTGSLLSVVPVEESDGDRFIATGSISGSDELTRIILQMNL